MILYDISQSLFEGMAVWPGDQPFTRYWTTRLDRSGPYNLSALTMSTHSGTHLDAPFHILEDGQDISTLALDRFIGPARVVSFGFKGAIHAEDLERLNWNGLKRILFKTNSASGQGVHFDPDFTFLTGEAAALIAEKGTLLVGIDSPSIDAFNCPEPAAHKALLQRGIPILEGLRLQDVPEGDYELICLPLKLPGGDGSPVRAVLRDNSRDERALGP